MSEAFVRRVTEECNSIGITVLDREEYEKIRYGPICPIFCYLLPVDNQGDDFPARFRDQILYRENDEEKAIFLSIKKVTHEKPLYRIKVIVFCTHFK